MANYASGRIARRAIKKDVFVGDKHSKNVLTTYATVPQKRATAVTLVPQFDAVIVAPRTALVNTNCQICQKVAVVNLFFCNAQPKCQTLVL